jgi:putative phosphoesterase
MRLAVLSDIHGNLPALEAVLADLDAEPPDAIVVAGDVCGGPLVPDCLAVLRARPEPLRWVRGNAERETVEAFDGTLDDEHDRGRIATAVAAALSRADRDELDGWPIALTLDGVCICHGSPRSDEEILTRGTPEDALRAALADAGAALVVGGHTHQQMIRSVDGGSVYVNAGSIGMPYEGEPAAFWAIVADGTPALRRTAYDVAAALERLRASGFPEVDEILDGSLERPVDPDWVTAYFEHLAGRGGDPGPELRLA